MAELKRLGNGLVLILITIFVLSNIFIIPYANGVIALLTAIVIALSLIYSKGLSKVFGLIMVFVGSAILLMQGQPVTVWMDGVTRNLALVCLIMVVPILSIPINLGNYDQKLAQFASRFTSKPQLLYLFISGSFSVLGPITNLGAIHIIHSMLDKLKLPVEFLGRVYARSFSSVNTWAPYFASVFLVVYSLGIPIATFLPYGLLLSFLQLATSNLLFSFKEVRTIKLEPMAIETVENPKKLYELLIVILLLTALIFFLEPNINLNTSVLILLIVLVFALVWSLYLKMPREFTTSANSFVKSILPRGANEISLLLTAGFFGVVLSKTVMATYINGLWSYLADISVLLFIFATIILIAALSFIGIHQIVTISAIIASVSYGQFGIHDITMAMTLLSAWAAATLVSPITPLSVVISNLLKVNVFTLIFRWNLLYAIIVACVHTVAIYIIHIMI